VMTARSRPVCLSHMSWLCFHALSGSAQAVDGQINVAHRIGELGEYSDVGKCDPEVAWKTRVICVSTSMY
jgi:hypothetical protein